MTIHTRSVLYFLGSGGINLGQHVHQVTSYARGVRLVLSLTTTKAPREGLLCFLVAEHLRYRRGLSIPFSAEIRLGIYLYIYSYY